MGMVNTEEKPVTPRSELQALGFALQELALYLDTHRDDKEALSLYRQYQKIYHDAMMEYGKNHGPMTHGMPSCQDGYAWLDDPWPWEYGQK
jgi:spore coat protein JB